MAPRQTGHDGRHHFHADDFADADPDRAGGRLRAVAQAGRRPLQRGGRAFHRLRVRAQRERGFRGQQAGLRAREQHEPERRLQRRHVAPDRGLRDAQCPRRAGQRAFAQHAEEGAIEFPFDA